MEFLGVSGWEVLFVFGPVLLVAAGVLGVYGLVRKASADGVRDAEGRRLEHVGAADRRPEGS